MKVYIVVNAKGERVSQFYSRKHFAVNQLPGKGIFASYYIGYKVLEYDLNKLTPVEIMSIK